MSDHIIFCCDIAKRDSDDEPITLLQGWCLGSLPINALAIQTRGGDFEPLFYGLRRDDVGRLHPQYPHSSNCGFHSITRIEIPADHLPALWVEIGDGKKKEDHVIKINLETRDIQTIELTDETRAAGAKIDDHNRNYSLALEGRLRQQLQTRGVTLRLDLINKCNLRCVMCHFSDDKIFRRPTSQLTTDQFKALFQKIGPSVSDVILSCGDEPLMSKFLPEILNYLASEHPHVAIEFCTNAMLMNAAIRKTIMETGVARIVFSIDAVSKKLLEEIRAGCRYERVVGNIMALRDLKQRLGASRPSFQFNFVIMDRNVHEAAAFVPMAKALGGESIDFRHMVPIPPYFDPADRLDTKPAKYNYYRDQIAGAASKFGLNYYLPPPFDTNESWNPSENIVVDLADFERVTADSAGDNLPNVRDAHKAAFERMPSAAQEFSATFCPRPFSEIMVRDQDEVLPCPWHRKTLGRLSEGKSLSEIFFGEDFARVRRNMLRLEGDPNCAHCPIKSGHLPTTANN